MTGLVFATIEEALPFLQRYERGRFDEMTEGDVLMDDRLIVTIIGSGKVKATLRTERFLQAHRPDVLLHVGLCIALKPEGKLADLISVSQVFEGDRIEMAAPTYPRIPLDTIDESLSEGILVTQDHLSREKAEQTYWQRIADYQDSTGYAVSYVAATHGVSCRIVKVVGGHADETKQDVRVARREAAEALGKYLVRFFS
jgi:nucleoside phosphorylase